MKIYRQLITGQARRSCIAYRLNVACGGSKATMNYQLEPATCTRAADSPMTAQRSRAGAKASSAKLDSRSLYESCADALSREIAQGYCNRANAWRRNALWPTHWDLPDSPSDGPYRNSLSAEFWSPTSG